jgi:hypothetical protein
VQTIKTKNCVVTPGGQPRFEAGPGDTVYYKDEKRHIAEAVIRSISEDGLTVSLSPNGRTDDKVIQTESIIAVVLGN